MRRRSSLNERERGHCASSPARLHHLLFHRIDPGAGGILRTIEANRVVIGVTWVDGEAWHGCRDGGESDVRRIDPHGGAVRERLDVPPGAGASGMESDGDLFCGGGWPRGKACAVRRLKRGQ